MVASTNNHFGPKCLFYRRLGSQGDNLVLIHGLGATSEYFSPLFPELQASYTLHLLDLEGHGQSPTVTDSVVSIESYANDVAEILTLHSVKRATLIAHSMGCLVAVQLAIQHPQLVDKLVLMGPPDTPFPEPVAEHMHSRGDDVRKNGMLEVADFQSERMTSPKAKASNRVAVAAIRLSLLGQTPEGYAKGCSAMASASSMDFLKIHCPVLFLAGSEDRICVPSRCEEYAAQVGGESKVVVLQDVGHFHVFEDFVGVGQAVTSFIK
ncbi:fumarylacetoacetate hydrolase [Pochonia chlamydosporia 170]|uniref:Fumarylacetoacetate hydrolase n=1 Tax=Pochonia chlamydosporia 170 TaxID=1380566 RepID=A0A179FS10_METCM|nr:fumarylacetoacetate hydrolase [Pochonia chlamydosporia 170]OAQ68426.1 fumarylacetoacetate hydrolase [Pochonia chlamydosporia 170]